MLAVGFGELFNSRDHRSREVGSAYFRHGGSIGPGSFPGHVIKGLRMAGRMGNERVTALNVEVVRVDPDKGLLFLRGGVPGHPDALLQVRPSVKARA